MANQAIAYLTAVVGADTTSFRSEMAKVRRELTDVGGIASGLQDIGRTLTMAITAPIIGAMGVAVSQFAEFEAEMRNIASISPLVAEDFEGVSDQIRRMGQEMRVGADGFAQAFYTVQSAGFGLNDLNEALRVTEQAAMLAEAGLSSIVPTTNTLVSTLLAYGETADAATFHSDVLAQTVALGVGSMEGLVNTLSSSINQSAALGVSFDDLGGTLAFLTQQGFNWARAGTAVGNLFNKLITPSAALSAIYSEIGVGSGQELITTFGGLEGALRELYEVVGNNPEALREIFPDDRGFRAALSIFNNMDRYTQLLSEFDATLDGATDTQRQQQMQSFAYKFDVMKNAMEGFFIVIGQAIAPVLTPLIDGLTELFDTISNMPPEIITLGVIFALIAAAIPPLIWGLGLLLTPLGVVFAIAATLGALFVTNFDDVYNWVQTNMPFVASGIEQVASALRDFADILTGTEWERDPSTVLMGGHELPQNPFPNLVEVDKTFGERIQEAWAATGDRMIIGIQTALIALGSWIQNEGVDLLDRTIGYLLYSISTIFGSSGKDGDSTPLTDGLRSLLSGGISSAIDSVGTWIDDNLPHVKTAFEMLLRNIGIWIETDGATSLGYAVGYIAVAIGNLIGQAISSIFSNKDKGNRFFDNIREGFESGLADAFTDFNITGGVDKALTLVVGLVAAALAAKFLLFGGMSSFAVFIGTGIWSMITSGISWLSTSVSALLPAAASTIATLVGGVVSGIFAGFAVWNNLTPDQQGSLSDFVRQIPAFFVEALTGVQVEGSDFDYALEASLSSFLAGIFDIANRPDIAASLRANAQRAVNTYAYGIAEGLDAYQMEAYGYSTTDTLNPLELYFANVSLDDVDWTEFNTRLAMAWDQGLNPYAWVSQPVMDEFLNGASDRIIGSQVMEERAQELQDVIARQDLFAGLPKAAGGAAEETKGVFEGLKNDTVTKMTGLKEGVVNNMNVVVQNLNAAAGLVGTALSNINKAMIDPVNSMINQMNNLKQAANDAMAAIGAAANTPIPQVPTASGGGSSDGGSGKGGSTKIFIQSSNPERIFSKTRAAGVDLVDRSQLNTIPNWGG